MTYTVLKKLLVSAALLFVLCGCSLPTDPDNAVRASTGGKGYVRLDFSGAARTLRPDSLEDLSLTRFTLEFSSEAGVHAPIEAADLSAFSDPIELEEGTWTPVLTGFSGPEAPASAVAEGRVEATIEPGKTATASIRLLPLGQGNFSYAGFLSLLEDQGLSFASMTLSSRLDDSVFRINLLNDNAAENPGSLELAAGYYRLTLALYGGAEYAEMSDAVHIYHDKTTSVPYTMNDFNFIPAVFFGDTGLAAALNSISETAQDGDTYIIQLTEDEPAFPRASLTYDGKKVTVVILGNGEGADTVTTSRAYSYESFSIGGGVTLELRDITLTGNNSYERYMISVKEGGEFIMDGATEISGNSQGVTVEGSFIMYNGAINNNSNGVSVDGNGMFTMNGGTINGNTASSGGGVSDDRVAFTMSGGTISGNVCPPSFNSRGGGVCVDRGMFTISGGTITDNSAVYGSGTWGPLTLSGDARIDPSNSIYLELLGDANITIAGPLTAPADDIMTIDIGNTYVVFYLLQQTVLQKAADYTGPLPFARFRLGNYAITSGYPPVIGPLAGYEIDADGLLMPVGTIPLTEDTWYDNEFSAETALSDYYKFYADDETTYHIAWNTMADGDGTKTGDIGVIARYNGSGYILEHGGWSNPQAITPSEPGMVILQVIKEAPGTYTIKYY
jgi:hypothetical protein